MTPSPNLTFVPARRLGPRGGDLDDPKRHPEWREAGLKGTLEETGLHTVKHRNTAMAGIQSEQPWHYMTAVMVASGFENAEIAEKAQVTLGEVQHLRAQLWFQQRLAEITRDMGAAITGALQSYALEAVEGIAELARVGKAERTRLTAYTTLLEHANGKATQRVISEVSHRNFSDPASELESIQNDLDSIRRARVAGSIQVQAQALPPLSQDADATSAAPSDVSRSESHATE